MAKKIVVSDDDHAILDALTLVLKDAGYLVTTNNGETVRAMRQGLPDLLLLDMWLSGHNGADICAQLKRQKHTKHIPIILISATRHIEQIAKKAGADDFLAKPFATATLLQKIAKHIR